MFLIENKHLKATVLAEMMNRTPASVRMAKKRWGLTGQKAYLGAGYEMKLRDRHGKGWSDERIARALYVNTETVRRWRRKLGLAANGWSESARGKQSAVKKRLGAKQRRVEFHRKKDTGQHRKESRRTLCDVTSPIAHDAEESEMLTAVSNFRNKHHRPPTLMEGFCIATSLGWQKA